MSASLITRSLFFLTASLWLLVSLNDWAIAEEAPVFADSVFINGDIHTIDTLGSRAEAVAIKDGKFIKVGSYEDMKAVTGKGTEVINLHGKMVMPGIIDVKSG